MQARQNSELKTCVICDRVSRTRVRQVSVPSTGLGCALIVHAVKKVWFWAFSNRVNGDLPFSSQTGKYELNHLTLSAW